MNIYDIAEKANVSPATVSRVINGNKSVREETRRKVQKIIEETNYVPNSLARNLSVGETRNIAFLAPDIENPFFSKILHGLSDTANHYGYNVFMYGTNDNLEIEHRILNDVQKERIKGFVIIPVSDKDKITAEKLESLEKNQIPIVLIDRDIIHAEFDGVFSDDCEGARQAVKCLIDSGHTRIAIITGERNSRPGRERLKGYEKALEESGIEKKSDYIVGGSFKENAAYQACQRLMDLKEPPTAIFTSNNLITLGCLKFMKDKDMKIGRDISMVCFDEIHELSCTDINLTTVDRPVYEMGCAALELLEYSFQSLTGNGKEKIMRRTNIVKTNLIIRGSEKLKK